MVVTRLARCNERRRTQLVASRAICCSNAADDKVRDFIYLVHIHGKGKKCVVKGANLFELNAYFVVKNQMDIDHENLIEPSTCMKVSAIEILPLS